MNEQPDLTYNVNEYLSLKLLEGKTQILVGEKVLQQCKMLVMNIPRPEVRKLEKINSMDELIEFAEKNGLTQEEVEEDFFNSGKEYDYNIDITQEEEFWAHCSTIQVWEESGYNTRLLDMRLAFPILKELAKLGDRKAKQKFKDEIYKRFTSVYPPVIIYLVEEGYLEFLTEEEMKTMFQQTGMIEISNYYEKNDEEILIPQELVRAFSDKQLELFISASDPSGVKVLNLYNGKIKKLPRAILKYRDLELLYLRDNKIEFLPERIDELANLKKLKLHNNNLKDLPDSIGNLKSLRILDLRNNNLHSLPDSIGNLENLEVLLLSGFGDENRDKKKPGNFLSTLPDAIKNLKNLASLHLSHNLFSEIPPQVYKLTSLKILNFSKNNLERISNELGQLNQLANLNLNHNKLKELPDSLGKLKRLKALSLDFNKITHLPESVKHLKELKRLDIKHNQLKSVPEGITNFSKLEELDLSYNPLRTVPEGIFELPNLKYLHLPTDKISPPESFLSKYRKSLEAEKDIWYFLKSE
ncbi:MAG: hypothetical protein GF353_26675 [Candidatus Lokiarchaeota archaeon]|nr:hypothetical protein [Candidatus Lokiarchaeota archaeon]